MPRARAQSQPMPRLRTARRLVAAAGAGLAMAPFAALAAGPTAPPLVVPDTLAQRVVPCATCHGKDGRATDRGFYPRIAGKPAGYLYNQLDNFRTGRRSNATMTYFVEQMSDDYLREIAGWFASLDLPYGPPQTIGAPPAELALGEALVRRGDPRRGVPACVACHGAAMTGVQPAVPGLLGLARGYLIEQFGAWRNGQRKALAPDCMARVATALTTQDVAAVATWLSSQPVGGPPAPAQAVPRPLPMACGSVPP